MALALSRASAQAADVLSARATKARHLGVAHLLELSIEIAEEVLLRIRKQAWDG